MYVKYITVNHYCYESFSSQAHQTGFPNSGQRKVTGGRSGREYCPNCVVQRKAEPKMSTGDLLSFLQ